MVHLLLLSYRYYIEKILILCSSGKNNFTFPRFPKIFQNCSEDQTNVPEHFLKISQNFRRFPKSPKTFEEDPKMLRSSNNELVSFKGTVNVRVARTIYIILFLPLSEDFRRFFKIVPKARQTFPNIFFKISQTF